MGLFSFLFGSRPERTAPVTPPARQPAGPATSAQPPLPPKEGPGGRFRPGQVWAFQGLPSQPKARLTILRVEDGGAAGPVVHIAISGVAYGDGQTSLPHLPFALAAIERSVTVLERETGPLPDFAEGYRVWREAFDSGKGGVFTLSVAEAFATVTGALPKAGEPGAPPTGVSSERGGPVPSNFACLGFPTEQAQVFALIDEIFANGDRRPGPGADYVPWNEGQGPEAWLHLEGNNFLAFAPHFSGPSRVRCHVTGEVVRERGSPLEMALSATVNPNGAGQGDYPIVFDSPDYHLGPRPAWPATVEVQLALFPRELGIFSSEQEFAAAQAERKARFASRSVVPSGLWGEGPPQSEVFACGHVKAVNTRKNPLTGREFLEIQFDTLGGVFDVPVCKLGEFSSIRAGDILAGTFWVSGRILPEQSRVA